MFWLVGWWLESRVLISRSLFSDSDFCRGKKMNSQSQSRSSSHHQARVLTFLVGDQKQTFISN